uniref:Uncharacterized protein n=1 Tax=Megaselia scalaris TaxID=36166 RepID=T1GY94_MEGSC
MKCNCPRVITPQKCGDVYVYDLIPSPPPSATISSCNSSQLFTLPNETVNDYDVPKPPTPILSTQLSYDFPKSSWCRSSFTQHNDMSTPPSSLVSRYSHQNSLPQLQEESYDVPRSSPNLKVLRQLQQSNITPSSSNSSLHLSDSLGSSISSSNRSSFMNASDYDVPRRNPIPVKKPYPLPNSSYIRSSCPSPSPSTSSTSGLATYDFPSPNPKLVLNKIEIAPKELPLSYNKRLKLWINCKMKLLPRLQELNENGQDIVSRFLSSGNISGDF